MPELSAICPKTGKSISTGVHTDFATLASVWRSNIAVKCPHCGETHSIVVCEAYVRSTLSSENVRGTYTALSASR
jgi:hypothetical protein